MLFLKPKDKMNNFEPEQSDISFIEDSKNTSEIALPLRNSIRFNGIG
jgi:hypothetical protein